MERKFEKLTLAWSKERKRKLAERVAELKVEHDAAADYYERTGKHFHTQGSVEQRKIIENYMEDHDLHI